MANQKSAKVLEEMVDFSVEVVSLCRRLSLSVPITNQVIRSATSIGANFSEAQDASSKKDFINKIYIAKKEASETKYWLTIIYRLSDQAETITALIQKAQLFTMMLQKIINSSRTNRKSSIATSSQMANSE